MLGGQVVDSLSQALLFTEDMQHYSSCRDEDIALKLKWHTIVISTLSSPADSMCLLLSFAFFFFFCLSVSP